MSRKRVKDGGGRKLPPSGHRAQVYAAQWAAVDYWRARLAATELPAAQTRVTHCGYSSVYDDDEIDAADNPALASLKMLWAAVRVVSSGSSADPTTWLQNEATHRDGPLLDAIHSWIDAGLFPPPEYMLALSDSLARYYRAEGAERLEDVFFGAPVQRAGNHAARTGAYIRNVLEEAYLAAEKRTARVSMVEVAKQFIKERHPSSSEDQLHASAESIARKARRTRASRTKKPAE